MKNTLKQPIAVEAKIALNKAKNVIFGKKWIFVESKPKNEAVGKLLI